AGDGADFNGIGSGPEAGGYGGIAEAEGAGGEELLRGGRTFRFELFLIFGRIWANEDFQGAAFDFFGVAGIDVVAWGQDEGARCEHFCLPAMGEAEVDDRCGR